MHHSACADNGTIPHSDTRQNSRTGTYEDAASDSCGSSQAGQRRDMREVANPAIVVNDRPMVDDHTGPDCDRRRHYCRRGNQTAQANVAMN